MKVFSYVQTKAGDFARGSKIIWRSLRNKEDLASMSKTIEGLIPTYGKDVIRKQVIKSIEDDIKKTGKNGDKALEKMMQDAFSCPEYMKLLRRINMDETHVRALIVMSKNKEKNKV